MESKSEGDDAKYWNETEVDTPLSHQILKEFIQSEFLNPVVKGAEYFHRISGSMCRVWFDDPNTDGWRYPSVHCMNRFNIAIKQKNAREKLILDEVKKVKIISPNSLLQKKSAIEVVLDSQKPISRKKILWTQPSSGKIIGYL